MPTPSKRKKVNVRVARPPKKSATKITEADLSEPIKEESLPVILKPAALRESPSRSRRTEADKKEKRAYEARPKLKINLYRKIAFSFIFLTLALLAVLFYFSFVKATIIIVPAKERIASSLAINVYDKNKEGENAPTGKGVILGVVEEAPLEETKTYEASGGEIIGEEAIGKATIINNYNKNQPLVATTRLLSPDGKLFRIKETVNAPAGDSVEVEIYADKPSADMAIGPSKFTIPGLWAGLQDKIYAESKEPVQYQKKTKKHITQDDIDSATADLKKVLLAKAENSLNDKYKDFNKIIYKIDDNSISVDVDGKVNEEKDNFSITVKANVVVVAFLDEPIKEMARKNLTSILASDRELKEFNNNIAYNLDNYDVRQGTAVINVNFEGTISLKDGNSVIDREKIAGLTKEQLKDYLDNIKGISGYEIKFSPSFISKVPTLVDRIEVKIKK